MEFISTLFILTAFLTVWLFCRAVRHPRLALTLLLSWLALQAAVALTGFFAVTDVMPPRLLLLVGFAILVILSMFVTAKGRVFIDNLDLGALTLMHVVRLPVEIVLLLLFYQQAIPELMTFEGRNFDILSGVSAPVIYYFVFVKKKAGRVVLLVWNLVCLGLLINIVTHAVLSAPFPFQQLAFDQPNVAVLTFPFIWLPGCVVPLVLFAHLAAFWLVRK
jgi:hypothetical protein